MRPFPLLVFGVLLLLPSAECHATCPFYEEGGDEKAVSSPAEPDTELTELAELAKE